MALDRADLPVAPAPRVTYHPPSPELCLELDAIERWQAGELAPRRARLDEAGRIEEERAAFVDPLAELAELDGCQGRGYTSATALAPLKHDRDATRRTYQGHPRTRGVG